MGFYDERILPALLDFAMRQGQLAQYRDDVAGAAKGRILEVGIGSGLNLSHYNPYIDSIVGLDPSGRLLSLARRRGDEAGVSALLLQGSATSIPLQDASVDSVVMTWTLCSVPDPLAALREIRRVLKPSGMLLFAEHGLAPEAEVQAWQHRLTPLWRHIAGGCHLDRKIDHLIAAAGLEIRDMRTSYAKGPRPLTFMYQGRAAPAL